MGFEEIPAPIVLHGFVWLRLAGRRWQNPTTLQHQVFVKNLEPVCAGVIAGGALMGITVILIETFALN